MKVKSIDCISRVIKIESGSHYGNIDTNDINYNYKTSLVCIIIKIYQRSGLLKRWVKSFYYHPIPKKNLGKIRENILEWFTGFTIQGEYYVPVRQTETVERL